MPRHGSYAARPVQRCYRYQPSRSRRRSANGERGGEESGRLLRRKLGYAARAPSPPPQTRSAHHPFHYDNARTFAARTTRVCDGRHPKGAGSILRELNPGVSARLTMASSVGSMRAKFAPRSGFLVASYARASRDTSFHAASEVTQPQALNELGRLDSNQRLPD